MKANTYKHS